MKISSNCNHWWCYAKELWQVNEGDETLAVGRYCSECGEMQTAIAKDWGPLPASFVDMRETLQESIDTGRI